LSLIATGLAFPPLLQTGISLMSGLGSIGYGLFWFLAGSFFIAVVGLFCMLGYKVFIQKVSPSK
jgi:hypothetical protein